MLAELLRETTTCCRRQARLHHAAAHFSREDLKWGIYQLHHRWTSERKCSLSKTSPHQIPQVTWLVALSLHRQCAHPIRCELFVVVRTSIANLTERQGGVTQTHQKAFHALPKVHRLRHRLSKVHRLRGTLGSSTTELAILPQPREPSLQPCTVCECCRERP